MHNQPRKVSKSLSFLIFLIAMESEDQRAKNLSYNRWNGCQSCLSVSVNKLSFSEEITQPIRAFSVCPRECVGFFAACRNTSRGKVTSQSVVECVIPIGTARWRLHTRQEGPWRPPSLHIDRYRNTKIWIQTKTDCSTVSSCCSRRLHEIIGMANKASLRCLQPIQPKKLHSELNWGSTQPSHYPTAHQVCPMKTAWIEV